MLKRAIILFTAAGALLAILTLASGFLNHSPGAWAMGMGGMGGGAWNGQGRGWGGCPMSYSGQPGGGDFRPGPGRLQNNRGNPAGNLSQDQAKAIVQGYLQRLGPEYKIAGISDAGSFYRFDIQAGDQKVESLAVDKNTGNLRPLN